MNKDMLPIYKLQNLLKRMLRHNLKTHGNKIHDMTHIHANGVDVATQNPSLPEKCRTKSGNGGNDNGCRGQKPIYQQSPDKYNKE